MSNKILDDMRDVMRRRHYSIRTERSYCGWMKRFILHFNMKSRDDLSERNVQTTMIYTHVLQQGGKGVISPLEDL